METDYQHTPVMLKEVMAILEPQTGQNFIDCTLGGGGYTTALAGRLGDSGKVLAIDLDEAAINNALTIIKNKKIKNIILENDNFKNLQKIAEEHFLPGSQFDGIVFDLGLSSNQLKDRSRGFSFSLADAPLGMNFGSAVSRTAESILNSSSLEELTGIFRNYGEERQAGRVARKIVESRQDAKIQTVGQLVRLIAEVLPVSALRSKIHPATKIFQALRLAVNGELDNISQALPQAVKLLKPGGKLVVLSYHSLEDRIIKNFFRQESRDCLCPPAYPICRCGHRAVLKVHKGILRPTEEEVLNNPRARSAKLRAAEKLA